MQEPCTSTVAINDDIISHPIFSGPISAVNESTTTTRWARLKEAKFTFDDKGYIDFSLPLDIKARALRATSGLAIALVFSDITYNGLQPLGQQYTDSAGRVWRHLTDLQAVYPTLPKGQGPNGSAWEPAACVYVLCESVSHLDIRGIIKQEYMGTSQLTLEQNIALEQTIANLLVHVGSLPVIPTLDDLPF